MAKKTGAAGSTTVEQTLKNLGIDEHEDGESTDVEEGDEGEGDEVDEEDDGEVDEEVDGDGEDALGEVAPTSRARPSGFVSKRSKLRDVLFSPGDKPSPQRIAPPPRAPSAVSEPITPLPHREEDPVYVMPQERVKKSRREPPPSVRKLGNALSRKLPGAERIKIKKRQENGSLGYIGEYTAADLASCSDVETFIMRFVKPKYGSGSYKLIGIDAGGNELDAGEVSVLDPDPVTQDSAVGILAQMLEQNQRTQRELMEQQRHAPGPDPISMLRGLQEVQQNMMPQPQPVPNGGADSLAAMMTLMMQSMQQQAAQAMAQQASMTQVLVAALTPKEDTETKALLRKLLEGGVANSNNMPLPPPPPPESPLKGMKEMMEVLVLAMGGTKKNDDSELKELVKAALAVKQDQTLTPRDVISLMQDMKSDRGTDDFRKGVENLSMLLQISNNLRGQQEGSASAGFFDALSALFSNRDFAGSIAQSIRLKTDQQAAAARMAQEQRLLQQKSELIDKVRARPAGGVDPVVMQQQVVQPQHQGTVVPLRRPQAVPQAGPQVVRPQATPQTQAPGGTQPPAPMSQAPLGEATPEALQAQEALARAPRPMPKIPPIPGQTYEHINGIVAAKDDAELIQNTVRMLVYFAEFEEWKNLTEMLLATVQSGQKKVAMQLMDQIFRGLSALGMVAPPVVERITTAFSTHFEMIQAGLDDVPLGTEGNNAIEQALADAEEEEEDDDDEDDDFDEDDDEVDEDEEEDDEDDEESGERRG